MHGQQKVVFNKTSFGFMELTYICIETFIRSEKLKDDCHDDSVAIHRV